MTTHDSLDEALERDQAAAQTHYVATILAAFGINPQKGLNQ